MSDLTVFLTVITFLITILFIFWRPRGLNEAIPAMLGAIVVIMSGSITRSDLGVIVTTVGGAATTIVATFMMAIVFESFGFFQWVVDWISRKAKGSGIRLFWYINLLCFFMTLFFNNDGGIFITTPILLQLLKHVGLKPHQKIPYLISGALITTAASAPIGVSNIVNLISLKIVGMSLYMYSALLFVPATLGLMLLVLLLFAYYYRELPHRLPMQYRQPIAKQPISYGLHFHHPLKSPPKLPKEESNIPLSKNKQTKWIRNLFSYVVAVRLSLFVASYFGIPVPLTAVIGSALLLAWRWLYFKMPPVDIVKKTPWHIFLFAFGMYVIIYGLHKIGLTQFLTDFLQPFVTQSVFHAIVIMGVLVTFMSDLFNNHPALMIGTLALTNMGLDPTSLKIAYVANVIGSDIGSLLLPIGTLATLIWMHKLNQEHVKIGWLHYIKISFLVIPITVLFTLVCLYFWVRIIF
ncbi:arsenic transporter [Fodinisporobacter ferrooxydans]|uniref:Arsenic transporter n=1 Tax=Fodinisporobacter ferrooxydans TaxID=2901836 RepID=A0ABY4CJM7_9BACL|nr:arsenic transporter [Alicyclobacillaceae bacterium MYW30-H2]